MDLTGTQIFVKVVSTGSFTAAATALGMPRSTVSRKLAELEAELGARLLQRTTRKLSLTDAGRTYYTFAGRAMSMLEAGGQAVGALQQAPQGRLRISAPIDLTFLGPIFSDYLARYPKVQLELDCRTQIVDLVEDGFDLAIRVGNLDDSTMVAQRLTSWRSILVASPDYCRSRPLPNSPEELRDHPCLIFATAGGPHIWRLQKGQRLVEVLPSGPILSNDHPTLEQAVLNGLGIALLPPFRLTHEQQSGALQRVLPAWQGPRHPLHAVYPSAQHLSPKVQALVTLLKTNLATPPWNQPPAHAPSE